MSFYLYKGLKKPLTFFGMKGKYIYYSAGTIGGGLMLGIILKSFIGFLGLLFAIALGGGALWWIIKMQDTKGLYNKTKNDVEIHIFPKKFNYKQLKYFKK